jgi:hypothetical protein
MRVLAKLAVVFAALLPSIAAGAGEKRGFEIADYYRTAFVGGPVVSGDGTRIAVSVTRYELEKGESWSEIWMAGSHGTAPGKCRRGGTTTRTRCSHPTAACSCSSRIEPARRPSSS